MPALARSLALNLRMTKRLALRRGASLHERFGPLDERMVFVIGSPRSGTTALATAIGSMPGFLDLGEVAPVKAAIPALAALPEAEAARRLRSTLAVARRFGLVGSVRAVEQTPEVAHIAAAVALAFPEGKLVHILRDGRDVVCSLLERGWLGASRCGEADDAGLSYGAGARFWVEPERRAEFAEVSEARRAAWVWRRYVAAARASTAYELRYEALVTDPVGASRGLAAHLDIPHEALAPTLATIHGSSVGRWQRDLTSEQLADVEAEAGELLRELGYLKLD